MLPRLTLCVLCACNERIKNGVFDTSELDLWKVKVFGLSVLSLRMFEGSVWTLFVSEEFKFWLCLCVQIIFLSCAESCKLSNRTRCPPTRITLQKEKHTDYTTTAQKHRNWSRTNTHMLKECTSPSLSVSVAGQFACQSCSWTSCQMEHHRAQHQRPHLQEGSLRNRKKKNKEIRLFNFLPKKKI